MNYYSFIASGSLVMFGLTTIFSSVALMIMSLRFNKRARIVKDYFLKKKAVSTESAIKLKTDLEKAAISDMVTRFSALNKTVDDKYWYDEKFEKNYRKIMYLLSGVLVVFVLLVTFLICGAFLISTLIVS